MGGKIELIRIMAFLFPTEVFLTVTLGYYLSEMLGCKLQTTKQNYYLKHASKYHSKIIYILYTQQIFLIRKKLLQRLNSCIFNGLLPLGYYWEISLLYVLHFTWVFFTNFTVILDFILENHEEELC